MEHLNTDEIPELLARLVDKSLVNIDGEGRYGCLQYIHSFAQEELFRSLNSEITRNRHFDYYADFCRQKGEAMLGADSIRAVEEFESEIENIRRAEEWAIANPATWHTATEMFDHICHFMDDHGWYGTGAALMENAIQHAPEDGGHGKALALSWLGTFQKARLDPAAADTCLRAIEVGKSSNNISAIARGLTQLAQIRHRQGNLEECDALAEQALKYVREAKLKHRESGILNTLGSFALQSGRFERAREFYEQAYRQNSEIGSLRGLAAAQGNLGHVHERLGQYELAYRNERESLQIFCALGNLINVAGALAACASGFWVAGDDEMAAMVVGASHRLCNDLETLLDGVDSETAERWRSRLVDRMGNEAYLAATERGSSMPLGDVVKMVLDRPEPWNNAVV